MQSRVVPISIISPSIQILPITVEILSDGDLLLAGSSVTRFVQNFVILAKF